MVVSEILFGVMQPVRFNCFPYFRNNLIIYALHAGILFL